MGAFIEILRFQDLSDVQQHIVVNENGAQQRGFRVQVMGRGPVQQGV
jgi:hypothetical protein